MATRNLTHPHARVPARAEALDVHATLLRQGSGLRRSTVSDSQAVALLLLAAFALRLPHLGDPSYMIDEQFYLVAGDKLLHGALPFVDVWDRKPIGLFLVYAVAAAFGPGAVLAYQLMALAAAAGTAVLIGRIARPVTGAGAGLVAGLLYLLWLEIAEGGGGQAPVFYNLLTAGAAWALLKAGDADEPARHRRFAFLAMLLVGIGIQIKYTVLFEGLFFGLVLSWWTIQREASLARAGGLILALAATALAPTLLAFAFYAAIGQAPAFWFANFVSIFQRGPAPPAILHDRIEMMLVLLTPFALCIAAGMWRERGRRDLAWWRWRTVMIGWCGAALVGLFAIGTLYLHYILPAFLPFAAAAAPAFRRPPVGATLALGAAIMPAAAIHYPDFARTEWHRREIAALTALIPPTVERGCLQMFDGPTILYWTSHACTLTRFVFPDHLAAGNEQEAIGVDTVAELKRVLALRPAAFTIGEPDPKAVNWRTYRLLRTALARDYRRVGSAPFDGHDIEVWARR